MSRIDELIAQEAEAAEEYEARGIDEPLPADTRVTRGHGRSRTLQVRLNEDEYARIEELAEQRQLPVSTLARSFLLGALKPTAGDEPGAGAAEVRQAVDQLHAARDDLKTLFEQLLHEPPHRQQSPTGRQPAAKKTVAKKAAAKKKSGAKTTTKTRRVKA